MQGQVRSWVDWPEAGLLLLNMRGNRWCGNVGRVHKSNGIFYVVDLQASHVFICHMQGGNFMSNCEKHSSSRSGRSAAPVHLACLKQTWHTAQ